MISEVDDALCAWLSDKLPRGVSLSFEPPATLANGVRQRQPVLDLFLYDVTEDVTGRSVDWEQLRDERGRVIARQPPTRRYDLSYLVTAWCPTTAKEHELLGAVLNEAASADVVPPQYLSGSLTTAGSLVIHAARPHPTSAPWALWDGLQISARLSVDLMIKVPVWPALVTELEPLAERVTLRSGQHTD
jgi:hypothetical protein